MRKIAKDVGARIRSRRTRLGLSQEKLAELSGCHPTYIGQIERGEKNATIESIFKISSALEISLSVLFEKLEEKDDDTRNIPLECYELLASKPKEAQERIIKIIMEIEDYKKL